VDDSHQIVVGATVVAAANDKEQLVPMLDAVPKTLSEQPGEVLADAGYCSEANLVELERRGIRGYVALGRERHQTPVHVVTVSHTEFLTVLS
jgi:hypothetical protein